jgi:hypothetical protein
MAALTTLTLAQKQALANALSNAAKLVYNELQHKPTNGQAATTAALAATKVLLDGAQG